MQSLDELPCIAMPLHIFVKWPIDERGKNQVMTGQVRTGQVRTGQVRTSQFR